jgi:hypothetical protein
MRLFFYFHPVLFWIVAGEIIVLILGSLVIALLHLWWSRRARRVTQMQEKLTQMLIRIISQRRDNQPAPLPAKYNSPAPWLTVIEDFDLRLSDPLWLSIKQGLMESYLLPFARKSARSRSWEKRAWAARAFSLQCSPGDEQHIRYLLYDKMPLVRLLAIPAAIQIGSEGMVRDLLVLMSRTARFTNYAYRDALVRADRTVYLQVREQLAATTDRALRIACLDVLSNRTDLKLLDLIEPDLSSADLQLRIEATRTLGHYPGTYSEEWLGKLIRDPEWQVRTTAAAAMGGLHSEPLIPCLLAALSDPIWWVRLNAALALVQYGERGYSALRALDLEVDRYAYEIAQYVLRLNDPSYEAS